MSLASVEQEEKDRIQYEMQLTGQGGKKWKTWPAGQDRREESKRGPKKVASSEDYILTLENFKH